MIRTGSTVATPKDVEHWHGASTDNKLVHIGISNILDGSSVTWTTLVTDGEYATVNEQK